MFFYTPIIIIEQCIPPSLHLKSITAVIFHSFEYQMQCMIISKNKSMEIQIITTVIIVTFITQSINSLTKHSVHLKEQMHPYISNAS
jgi:hypothetical protein